MIENLIVADTILIIMLAFLAVSSLFIDYSHEAVIYMFVILVATLSVLAFLIILYVFHDITGGVL